MSRSAVALLVFAALVAMAVAFVLVGSDRGTAPEEPGISAEPGAVEQPELAEKSSEPEEGWQVTLYFPGQDGLLHPEERRFATESALPPDDPAQQVELVVAALLAGPNDPALRSPLPADTELLGVEVQAAEKIAWIDLGPRRAEVSEVESPTTSVLEPGEPRSLQGGSKQELLTVYSLVSSLTLSLEAVERVGLLWNGNQASTFAGHVDTTRPLRANERYLAQR